MTEVNPVLYILMRDDLPSMNAGKAMAQSSHASNAFIHEFENGDHDPKWDYLVEEWREETMQGFGTVLVLAVNEHEMRATIDLADTLGFINGVVHDPTYPIQIAPELGMKMTMIPGLGIAMVANDIHVGKNHNYVTVPMDTCVFLFGDKNDPLLEAIVGRFPLHP